MPVIKLRLGPNHSPTQSSFWKLWMLSQQAKKLLAEAAGWLPDWSWLFPSEIYVAIVSWFFQTIFTSSDRLQMQAGCEPLQTMEHSVSFQHQSTYSLLQFLRLAHVERGKVCAKMHKIDRKLLQSETLGHPFISSTASIWNCIWNVV